MKQTTIMLVMFGALITGSLNALAESGNPFAFETNKHPLEYDYCKKVDLDAIETHSDFDHYSYECSSAPKIHPDVGNYYLTFVEDIGLCFIGANSFGFRDFGNTKENMFFGNTEENMFEEFKLQLAKKYGLPARKNDRNAAGSYRYDWDQEAGFKGLGDVRTIWLKMRAHEGYYYVEVGFQLVTFDACQNKVQDMKFSAF